MDCMSSIRRAGITDQPTEGGLSDEEIALTEQYHFQEMLPGPRVLRTETAALTAITALQ